jgi:hypothetical protein
MTIQFTVGGGLNYNNNSCALILAKEKYPEWFFEDTEITSIFDCFPQLIWNGAVYYENQPLMQKAQMRQRVDFFNRRNISVHFTFTNSLLTREHLTDELGNWALKAFARPLNAVVINNALLEEHIRRNYPQYKIIASTTKVIRDLEQTKQAMTTYDQVVVAPEFNRDINALKQFPADKAVLLVNEPCAAYCPYKTEHYNLLARVNLKQLPPAEAVGFCPPGRRKNQNVLSRTEILFLKNETGITNFKIACRESLSPERAVQAYTGYLIREKHLKNVLDFMRGIIQAEDILAR